MIVSKQSAVKAGEKTRTFFLLPLGNAFNTSSVNGESHLLVSLD